MLWAARDEAERGAKRRNDVRLEGESASPRYVSEESLAVKARKTLRRTKRAYNFVKVSTSLYLPVLARLQR